MGEKFGLDFVLKVFRRFFGLVLVIGGIFNFIYIDDDVRVN